MKRYFQIQGWLNFSDTYDRAVHLFPSGSRFVEVGCWKGRSTLYMLEAIARSGKQITLSCVDTWEGSAEHNGVKPDALFAEFVDNIKGYTVEVLKMRSVAAAVLFAHGSLDFVFIDASHEEEDVFNDIAAWTPKLKATGVIAGDDISEFPGVKAALLRHGFGTKERPIVLGGSAQPAWIIPPAGRESEWVTPKA